MPEEEMPPYQPYPDDLPRTSIPLFRLKKTYLPNDSLLKIAKEFDMEIALARRPNGTYQPLPSVWDGEDSELLELMLNFYHQDNTGH